MCKLQLFRNNSVCEIEKKCIQICIWKSFPIFILIRNINTK